MLRRTLSSLMSPTTYAAARRVLAPEASGLSKKKAVELRLHTAAVAALVGSVYGIVTADVDDDIVARAAGGVAAGGAIGAALPWSLVVFPLSALIVAREASLQARHRRERAESDVKQMERTIKELHEDKYELIRKLQEARAQSK